jgi:hypothetical protein
MKLKFGFIVYMFCMSTFCFADQKIVTGYLGHRIILEANGALNILPILDDPKNIGTSKSWGEINAKAGYIFGTNTLINIGYLQFPIKEYGLKPSGYFIEYVKYSSSYLAPAGPFYKLGVEKTNYLFIPDNSISQLNSNSHNSDDYNVKGEVFSINYGFGYSKLFSNQILLNYSIDFKLPLGEMKSNIEEYYYNRILSLKLGVGYVF